MRFIYLIILFCYDNMRKCNLKKKVKLRRTNVPKNIEDHIQFIRDLLNFIHVKHQMDTLQNIT